MRQLQLTSKAFRRFGVLVSLVAVGLGLNAVLGPASALAQSCPCGIGAGSCGEIDEEDYVEGILVEIWDPYSSRGAACGGHQWEPSSRGNARDHLRRFREQCVFHGGLLGGRCKELIVETRLDYRDFYSCRGLLLQGLGLGTAAVLANTSLDEDFQWWHDSNVKSASSDDLSGAVKWLGEGRITIPICAGAALLSVRFTDINTPVGAVGEWGSRCLRGFAVGAPSLLALKFLLNGARPDDDIGSHWRSFKSPYHEAAVSGHAFVGAVPFLTAARMTDRLILKAGLYAVSALPAWSRINDRRHYLSQAVFGWWLAWVAVEVVHRTELFQENFVILPQASPGGFGARAIWRW